MLIPQSLICQNWDLTHDCMNQLLTILEEEKSKAGHLEVHRFRML